MYGTVAEGPRLAVVAHSPYSATTTAKAQLEPSLSFSVRFACLVEWHGRGHSCMLTVSMARPHKKSRLADELVSINSPDKINHGTTSR